MQCLGRLFISVYFASKSGGDIVIGFTNFCDLTLHDKFFPDGAEGVGSDLIFFCSKSRWLISAEVREMTNSQDFFFNTQRHKL
jgi:hypothetical protein